MGTVIYKKLVEVRILQDFYLGAHDETSFFDLSGADRLIRLNNLLARSEYDIRKDLRIAPTEGTGTYFNNHRIRFITTATGFFLAAEVRAVESGGADRYQMIIPPEANPGWKFTIQVINPQFINFTNVIQAGEVSSAYFLSNLNPDSTKVYPSLSMPVVPFTMGETYEMGDLSIIGGDLRQALKQTASAASGWIVLPADHRWVNSSDRHLLSTRFRYAFINPSVNTAAFALSDTDGNPVTTVSSGDAGVTTIRNEDGDLVEMMVDFTTYQNGADEVTLSEGSYSLEVSENGAPVRTLNVHFHNDIAMGFAGILLQPKTADPDFGFLEDDGTTKGLLIRRPDGSHPVFEIRLKNRITYWRYYSVTSNELEAKNKATLFLDAPAASGFLVTKDPKSLQQEPVYFVDGGDKIYLPNPINAQIRPEPDGKLYSDIFLSEIKGLIENKI